MIIIFLTYLKYESEGLPKIVPEMNVHTCFFIHFEIHVIFSVY
jgi:hypothetical protein